MSEKSEKFDVRIVNFDFPEILASNEMLKVGMSLKNTELINSNHYPYRTGEEDTKNNLVNILGYHFGILLKWVKFDVRNNISLGKTWQNVAICQTNGNKTKEKLPLC